MTAALGSLLPVPASEHPELLPAAVLDAARRDGVLADLGVVAIDPALSDTAATKERYGLDDADLANCVVVAGSRGGQERVAACVVLAESRADVNGAVRRLLDVRKASFLPTDRAVQESGMEYGGITPIGLPAGWRVLVDSRVLLRPLVVIGSGVRRSKIVLPGSALERVAGVEVVEGLGLPPML
jgi:prolyl-tRNA editing enzyme YbaK/EbsC (Cys-tRNA(Pro) deacylase)